MLLGLHIKNFASLVDVKVGLDVDQLSGLNESTTSSERKNFSLQSVSVLIGANNAGKSSVLQALDFLQDCVLHGVTSAAQMNGRHGFFDLRTRGTDEPMSLRILFSSAKTGIIYNYMLQIGDNDQGKPLITAESLQIVEQETGDFFRCADDKFTARFGTHEESQVVKPYDLPLLSVYAKLPGADFCREPYEYIEHWLYISFPALMNQPGRASRDFMLQASQLGNLSGGHRHINRYADNVPNVLAYLQKKHPNIYQEFLQTVRQSVKLTANLKNALINSDFSNADARYFLLVLLLFDPKPRSLLLLDAPESELYPDKINSLAEQLRRFSFKTSSQILLTTHSLGLVDNFAPWEVWLFKNHTQTAPLENSDWNDEWNRLAYQVFPVEGEEKKPEISKSGVAVKAGVVAKCVAADPKVRAMYNEGIGLASLWYSGHFE